MPHSKIISGIDIGTSKIVVIIGQYHQEEEHLNVIAVSSATPTGFKKGQIVDLSQATQTLTTVIESAERMAGFSIKNAFISITAPHIESINTSGVVAISNPNGEINLDDIARVIEASKTVSTPADKEIIHVIPRSFTVDGQDGIIDPIGMNGVRLEVKSHIILASSSAIRNLGKVLDESGIHPDEIIYSGLSSARAVLTNTEKELGVALVDIGGSTTNITAFIDSSPIFSSVIPIGANNITNDLVFGLRSSVDDAEKIKLKLGKVGENKRFEDDIDLSDLELSDSTNHKLSFQTAVNGIIKPRLEETIKMIQQQLIQAGILSSIPAGIVITGGGSLTVGIRDIFDQIIQLPLRVAYPTKVSGVVDDIISPAHSSAIGLILGGVDRLRENKTSTSRKKTGQSINNIFDKVKALLEPLLP